MKGFIYLLAISFFAFFITSTQNANAQNHRKEKRTVIIKKQSKRVSSKRVIYKKPKKKVIAVRTLPNKTIITHKGVTYHYANNKFYTYSGGRYIVITPKIGFRIKKLPVGFKVINHHNRNYFWAHGIFYIQTDNQYEVVEPEIGTIIYELPDEYERVEVDGHIYYEFSNVLYEKIQINGTRAYEVIGFIEQ